MEEQGDGRERRRFLTGHTEDAGLRSCGARSVWSLGSPNGDNEQSSSPATERPPFGDRDKFRATEPASSLNYRRCTVHQQFGLGVPQVPPTRSPRAYGVRRCRGVSVRWYLGTTCPGLERGRRLLCGRGRRKEAPGPERRRRLGFLPHLLLPSTEELRLRVAGGACVRPPLPRDPGVRTPAPPPSDPGVWTPSPSPVSPGGSRPAAPPPSFPGVRTPGSRGRGGRTQAPPATRNRSSSVLGSSR